MMNINLRTILHYILILHFFSLYENSYVLDAKHRIQAEIRNDMGHHNHNHHHPHLHRSHRLAHRPNHHYVHQNERRSLHVHRQHRNRWSSVRRKSMGHNHFTGWTEWSPCNHECVKRRERFCKIKRKCGFTKHIEERKCLHCYPKILWPSASPAPYDSQTHYHYQQPQQQQQQQQQQSLHGEDSRSQSIVINAAAAAATPVVTEEHPYTHPPVTVEHRYIPVPIIPNIPIIHTEGSARYPEEPVSYIENDDESLEVHQYRYYKPKQSNFHNYYEQKRSEDDGYFSSSQEIEDKDDFHIVNTRRHQRKKQKNRKKLPVDVDYVDSDLEVTDYRRHKKPVKGTHNRNSEEEFDWRNDYDDNEEENLEGPYLRRRHDTVQNLETRHLKSPKQQQRLPDWRTPPEYEGISGDTFQYEDFDFDPHIGNTVHDSESTPKSDRIYGDSYEEVDYGEQVQQHNRLSANSSSSSSSSYSREKATPDTAMMRHRRIYSKWSRWTKCSPKCTTRRYKKCRVREKCGREVLREIAYCYTEGSFCQQWLQAQVQKSPAYELRPMAVSSRRRDVSADSSGGALSNAIVSDFIMNGKGYNGPEYMPVKLKCGIAPIHNNNNRRNLYNMLKIIGGKTAKKGEWPWQVAIFNRFKEAFCGGTLIAPQWVMTAAHCVRKVLYVRLGEHNLDFDDGTELQLRVLKSFKHPNFDKKTVDSDIALLKLPKPINTTTWIGFSCLPKPFQPLPKNIDCTVIGWGKRRNRDAAGTSVLHQAEVPIIPMDNCRSVYEDYTITKNMFCAGHKRGRIDTCAGDSGGPLLCRDTTKPNHPWTIFGITSFGDGCAKRNKFGIYAKVPNYVDWIWSVINCNGNCKLHQHNYS